MYICYVQFVILYKLLCIYTLQKHDSLLLNYSIVYTHTTGERHLPQIRQDGLRRAADVSGGAGAPDDG